MLSFYVQNKKPMPDIAQTPKGVPTPALITRAVHELASFNNIEIFKS